MTADFVFVTRSRGHQSGDSLQQVIDAWSSGKSYKIRYWSTPILHCGCWTELELHANPLCVIEGKDQNPVSEICRALLSITCNWRWLESVGRVGQTLITRVLVYPKNTWNAILEDESRRKELCSLCHACSQACSRKSLCGCCKIMDRQSYRSEMFQFGKVKTQPRDVPLPRRQPDFTKPFQALAHRPSSCFKP